MLMLDDFIEIFYGMTTARVIKLEVQHRFEIETLMPSITLNATNKEVL
ncbi:hypothetical protein HPTD01_2526 [Halomonas sp. TD01]|nr:hypothetical protein GME_03025 [Halomonas sp. TD01]CAH1044048.1 hypothetical protein HPTD01_2526 [Halomonas sp. TD01]